MSKLFIMIRVESINIVDGWNLVCFNGNLCKIYSSKGLPITPTPIEHQPAIALFHNLSTAYITKTQILIARINQLCTTHQLNGLNIYQDVVFGSFSWSLNGEYIAFIAEYSTTKEEYSYQHTLGEFLAPKQSPAIAIYSLPQNTIKYINLPSLLPQRPIFAPHNEIIFSGFDTQPNHFIPGIFYCLNRVSHLYELKSVEEPTHKLIAGDLICQGHRFADDQRIVYFAAEEAFVHALMDIKIIAYPSYAQITLIKSPYGIYGGYYYLNAHCYVNNSKLYFNVHKEASIRSLCADLNESTVHEIYGNDTQIVCGTGESSICCSSSITDGIAIILQIKELSNKIIEKPASFAIDRQDYWVEGIHSIKLTKSATIPKAYLIYLHGGPHASFTTAYSQEFSTYLSHSLCILAVNYPGSIGYGKIFMQSSTGKMGNGEHLQLFAIIKQLVNDNNAPIYLYGGSHGGYLAAICAAHWNINHTLKGCILRSPSLDLNYMNSYSDIPEWPIEEGLGYKSDGYTTIEQHLQLIQISATNTCSLIDCPILLLLGDNDKRVPMTIGQYFWRIMKLNSKQCEIYVYHSDHSLSNVNDKVTNKVVSWIDGIYSKK